MYENFYGTYLRLDNFIIDVIFKEYNNMSELKKEFEEAIEYSDISQFNPEDLYLNYEVDESEINFSEQRPKLSERKENLQPNRLTVDTIYDIVNTMVERGVNGQVDTFEVLDKFASRYRNKVASLTHTIDYGDVQLCNNLMDKDLNMIIEWTKGISKDGMIKKDKLGIWLIFFGLVDQLDLTDIANMIKAEKVLMNKQEFLDTSFKFETLLENGKEDGYVPFERPLRLKQLIVESIFNNQDNIDLVYF